MRGIENGSALGRSVFSNHLYVVSSASTELIASGGNCSNSTSDPPRRFTNLFGTLAEAGDYFQLAVRTAQLKQTKGIGVLYEPNNMFASECRDGVIELCAELGVPVKGDPVAYDGSDNTVLQTINSAVDTLIGFYVQTVNPPLLR